MTPTHIADAIANYEAGIAEPPIDCTHRNPQGQCPTPAAWDLLWTCGEHDGTAHLCGLHKAYWLAPRNATRVLCNGHPEPARARWVAAYPRRRT